MINIKQAHRSSILCLFTLVVLSGCSTSFNNSAFITVETQSLYLDEQYAGFAEVEIESVEEVFAIDDEMRQVVKQNLLPIKNYKKRASQLLQHIFSKNNINLVYQTNANLTAIQTYRSNTANCMSLTILAFVLAKEAGLEVKFQQLRVPEYWVRDGDYNLLAGHVNLVITNPVSFSRTKYWGTEVLEIDFDPLITQKSFPKKLIGQSTVLAMFYNNKGAQLLIQKNYIEAYAYIRRSTQVDPEFSPSWSNLGILYKLNGNAELAKTVYRHAIALDSNNLTALTNLSFLLKKQGDVEEVEAINKFLSAKRSRNPYYQALLANNAYRNGELQKSVKLYRKAIRLKSDSHEFYYGMAMAYNQLDNWSAAESAMRKALYHNHLEATEKEYKAVLDSIKTQKKAL